MPDELGGGDPPTRRARLIDLLDGYLEFAQGLPGLLHRTGPDVGFPLSWRHYVYGMAYLRRHALRDMQRHAEACRAGNAVGDGFEQWRQDMASRERRG